MIFKFPAIVNLYTSLISSSSSAFQSKFQLFFFKVVLQSAFVNNDWHTDSTASWSEKLKSNEINLETVFVDTLVNNLKDAQHHLTKKLGDFWLKRVI